MTELEKQLDKELNPEQYFSAIHMRGPAVIAAGAGSGKTHTLISRIMHLVDCSVDPKRIIMLTFTNAAANEMKNRASNVNEDCQKILATTYHKYCSMLLRKYGTAIGIRPSFETLTPAKYRTFIEYVKSRTEYENLENFPSSSKLSAVYSIMTNTTIPISKLIAGTSYELYEEQILDLHKQVKEYGLSLEQQVLDFDDLLVYANKLLENEEICKKVANSFDYLMIDEFQDTNHLQLEFLKKLGQYNWNIVIVGDVSQSIYKFRGAEATNIQKFCDYFSKFTECKTYYLNINYRSTQEILDAANAVMNEHVKSWDYLDMYSEDVHGDKPLIKRHFDVADQNNWLVNKIEQWHASGINYSDIAIIERRSMSSFKLESDLLRSNIAYEKRGGKKLTEYQCVDELISFLHIVEDESRANTFEWFNVFKLLPGVGNKAATDLSNDINNKEFLVKYSRKKYFSEIETLLSNVDILSKAKLTLSPDELINEVAKCYFDLRKRKIELSRMSSSAKFDAKEKIESDQNVISAVSSLATYYSTLEEFLEDMALDSIKKPDESDDKVVITTIHSAKGLEWPIVILIDCIDHDLPADEFEEELRCWYVAMTRAKKQLIISFANRTVLGRDVVFNRLNSILNCALKKFEIE